MAKKLAELSVLVVDDAESVLQAVSKMLGRLGIVAVAVARDGAEALEVAAAREFDLIICDINLPKVNGIEVVKELRRAENRTPIIAITGSDQMTTAVDAVAAGASLFLLKPFDTARLLDRIVTATGARVPPPPETDGAAAAPAKPA